MFVRAPPSKQWNKRLKKNACHQEEDNERSVGGYSYHACPERDDTREYDTYPKRNDNGQVAERRRGYFMHR